MTETAPILAILTCPRCGRSLGTHNGRRLFLGSAVIARVVTLECAACGTRRQWYPQTPLDTGEDIPYAAAQDERTGGQ